MSSLTKGSQYSTPQYAQQPTDNLVSVFAETMRLAGGTGAVDSAACAAVGSLTAANLEEIRTLRNPPAVVRRTLEATFLMLNAHKSCSHSPPSWQRVKRMLTDASFLSRMQDYDADALRGAPELAAFIAKEYFGSGGTSPRTRSSSKNASRHSTQLVRGGSCGSRSSAPVLRRQSTWSAHDHKAVTGDEEPLSFRRVRFASHAAASLFVWCTASLVEGLDLDVRDVIPSLMDSAAGVGGGSPDRDSKESPTAMHGVHVESLPNLNEGSCGASASTAPMASMTSSVASKTPTPVMPMFTHAAPASKPASGLPTPAQTHSNAAEETRVEPAKKGDSTACACGGSPDRDGKDGPTATHGVYVESLPNLNEGSCGASASTVPMASMTSSVASKTPTPVIPTLTQETPVLKPASRLPTRAPTQTRVDAADEKKEEPAKKVTTKPDRHFELVCSFDMGYSNWTESGVLALQTVAATMCMRKNLCLMVLGAPAAIESDALDRARLRIVQEFFSQSGLVAATSPEPTRVVKDGSDPGVVCQVSLGRDRELRDYFLLREEGETLRLTAATRVLVDMLEQDFKTVKDDQ